MQDALYALIMSAKNRKTYDTWKCLGLLDPGVQFTILPERVQILD